VGLSDANIFDGGKLGPVITLHIQLTTFRTAPSAWVVCCPNTYTISIIVSLCIIFAIENFWLWGLGQAYRTLFAALLLSKEVGAQHLLVAPNAGIPVLGMAERHVIG
jgi:hypothetical protein